MKRTQTRKFWFLQQLYKKENELKIETQMSLKSQHSGECTKCFEQQRLYKLKLSTCPAPHMHMDIKELKFDRSKTMQIDQESD